MLLLSIAYIRLAMVLCGCSLLVDTLVKEGGVCLVMGKPIGALISYFYQSLIREESPIDVKYH